EVDRGWATAEVIVDHLGPRAAIELEARGAEQVDVVAVVLPPGGDPATDVIDQPEDRDRRGGVNRRRARLVVERDIAARDGDAELDATVREPRDRPLELPH